MYRLLHFYVWDGGVVSALATTTATSPFSRLHNDTLMILTALKYSFRESAPVHRCRQQYIYRRPFLTSYPSVSSSSRHNHPLGNLIVGIFLRSQHPHRHHQ
jgi:hypothetical protein